MLVKKIKAKGTPQLNLILCRYNALNNDTIMRLYLNDWTLIQNMQGFGIKRHAELKHILNNMKVGGEIMKWAKLREQKDREALETLIKEMKELGWVKRPDTKERYVPHYIEFVKDDHWIVIEWNEFVTFGNNLTVNGYVLIAITKYLKAVKL